MEQLLPIEAAEIPPSDTTGYGGENKAQRSRLHKAQNPFNTTKTTRLRGSNKYTSRHTTTRATISSSLEYLTRCVANYPRKTKNACKIHTKDPRMPSKLAPTSPKACVLSLVETINTSSGWLQINSENSQVL